MLGSPVQMKVASIKQTEEHPSEDNPSPSSQVSIGTAIKLSPQVLVQTLGLFPTQLKPCSIVQVLEHPSRFPRFPSSQNSSAAFNPSPHSNEQTSGVPKTHVYPNSYKQVAEHPSLGVVFPSSQVSSPAQIWSLHYVVHTSNVPTPPPTQLNPGNSAVQSAVHPNPSFWIPSSHSSGGDNLSRFPHTSQFWGIDPSQWPFVSS